MFTAGRYEYRNKGVDMFIESLARAWPLHSCATCSYPLIRVELSSPKGRFHGHCRCVHHYARQHPFLHRGGPQRPSRYQAITRYSDRDTEQSGCSIIRPRSSIPRVCVEYPFFFAWPDISSVTRRRFPHPTNCFLKKIKCY